MKKNVFSAVAVISLFTILDRALGFIFKIFLSRTIGAQALGVYQVALSVFFVLLTATTSGIPLVISKLTAKYRANSQFRREASLTSAGLVLGIIVATSICLVVLLLFYPISQLFADRRSAVVLLLLLPSLLFSSVYSALRGNLWGKQRYFLVSIVENLEQFARIIACFILFALGFNKLYMTALSLSVGCAFAMVAVICCFISAKGKIASPKGEFIPLIRSSTPITVSRASSSIVSSIIAVVVPFLLIASGYSSNDAMAQYGVSMGMAMPLLYIPITFVGSLAFVLIPTVAKGINDNKIHTVNTHIENAIFFSVFVSSIFLPMFAALGEHIGSFVYDNVQAGRFLSISAWLLVPLSIENITSSVMNSLDLEIKSFINYLIGSVLTFAIIFVFYGNFTINILSFALGIGWSLTSVLHIISIRRKTNLGFSFIPKSILSFVLILPSYFITRWLYSLSAPLGNFLALSISSLGGIIFFGLGSFAFGLIDGIAIFSRPKKIKKSPQNLLAKN